MLYSLIVSRCVYNVCTMLCYREIYVTDVCKKTLLIDYRLVESGNELRKYKHMENKHISHGNVIAYRLSI